MFERYTEKARRVIFFARYEASQYGSAFIETEHLLLGLVREDLSLFKRFLRNSDPQDVIRVEIDKRTRKNTATTTSIDLPLSRESKRALTCAMEEADRLSHKHIGTEHLLLGLMEEDEKCIAAQVLHKLGMEAAKIREWIAKRPATLVAFRPHTHTAMGPLISRETVVIHGTHHNAEMIRTRVGECRTFSWYWRPQQWTSRDLAVERSTGQISFDLSVAENNEAFDIAEKAWKYDRCVICHWKLEQSPEGEHSTGYTNGRDWVCVECYEKFLKRGAYFQSEYRDLT